MIFTGEHYYLGLIQAALAVFYVLFGVFFAGRSSRGGAGCSTAWERGSSAPIF